MCWRGTVQAHAIRRRWLDWAVDHRALVLPAHFNGPSALEAERRGGGHGLRAWGPLDRY